MEHVIQLLSAAVGTLAFAMFFNIHGQKLLIATIGGFIAWGTYLLAEYFSGDPYFSGFMASVISTIFAELMARLFKTPVTVFLVPTVISLIPGAALYRSMNALMQKDYAGFRAESFYTLLFAASMAAGITLTTISFRMVWNWLYQQRRL